VSGTIPTTYEFDEATQTEILACICWDQDFSRRTDGLIEPAYFENAAEQVLADIALAHFAKYAETPSNTVWIELLKENLKSGRIRSDQKIDVIEKLRETNKLTVRSRAWIMDKIAEFAQQRAIINGMLEASTALFKTSDPDRFAKVSKVMNTAFNVGLNTKDEDYDYFDRIEERTAERKDVAAGGRPKTGVTTGVKELDQILKHQGWGRKELTAYIGGAKASKSFHLSFHAAKAVEAGHNTLFITLENSIEILATRIDAFMSNVPITDEFKSPVTMEVGVKNAGARPGRGILKLRRCPAGTFKPNDLRRLLEEYHTKGISFDLVAIDYTDIMAPNHVTNDHIQNSKSVLVDVRQIADDENLAVLTCFQTNREGHKSAVVRAEHAAEDFNKIRIADLVLGINRMDEEKANQKARITFVAARNQPDGYTLMVKQDLNLGRAISEVESVE
jgi:replicative DNA helicase